MWVREWGEQLYVSDKKEECIECEWKNKEKLSESERMKNSWVWAKIIECEWKKEWE